MSWISPAIAITDVQKRFASVTTNAIPAETLTIALDDAEQWLRPRAEAVWGTSCNTSAVLKALCIKLAAANVYRSAFGMKTFGANEAILFSRELQKEVFEEFYGKDVGGKLVGGLIAGPLPGFALDDIISTDAEETSPVFSYGDTETYSEPSNTIEADAEERRRF